MAIEVSLCEILFLTFLKRTLELAISCCLSFLLNSDFAGLTLDMDIATGFAGKFSVTDGTAAFFTVMFHHVVFQLSVGWFKYDLWPFGGNFSALLGLHFSTFLCIFCISLYFTL